MVVSPKKHTQNPLAHPLSGQDIHVLGGGMVGVSVALELQSRGARITLVDRREPGKETSWGNAGVLSRSSLIPLNNPTLWRNLPGLMGNRRPHLRYDVNFLLRNPLWLMGFLACARQPFFERTTHALNDLIQLSIAIHLDRIAECEQSHRLSDAGWLVLYRNIEGFERAEPLQLVMDEFGINTTVLNPYEVRELEPNLKPVFERAVWVRDCYSVNNPGAIVTAYADRFAQNGGEIVKAEVLGIDHFKDAARIRYSDGQERTCNQTVICLGPWSRELVEDMDYRVPLGFERGYHKHYTGDLNDKPNGGLQRPVYDSSGGFNLLPMEMGIRLCTGVELCARDAPLNLRQITQAEIGARQVINLGKATDTDCWMGSRPTFPDSCPVIGALPGTRNIWTCFGHQHIGFSTGPGSARILADIMEGCEPPVTPFPFRPERYIRKC